MYPFSHHCVFCRLYFNCILIPSFSTPYPPLSSSFFSIYPLLPPQFFLLYSYILIQSFSPSYNPLLPPHPVLYFFTLILFPFTLPHLLLFLSVLFLCLPIPFYIQIYFPLFPFFPFLPLFPFLFPFILPPLFLLPIPLPFTPPVFVDLFLFPSSICSFKK